MKQSVPLLATHLRVGIAQDETDCSEKVTLPRAIASNDHIVLW